MLPWGPVIPRSRRSLFKDQSFGARDKAYIRQTSCMRVRRCMQRKSGGGRRSAPEIVGFREPLFLPVLITTHICHILLPFLALLFVRFFCRRLFAQIFDLRSWLSVSLPLRSVGTPSPPSRESRFFKPRNNLEPCTDSLELCRRVWHRRKSEQRTFG